MAAPSETQILLFHVANASKLGDRLSKEYEIWMKALSILERSNEVRRLAWGIGVKRSQEAQIHIVRPSMQAHYAYLAGQVHSRVLEILSELRKKPPTVRHVSMQPFTTDKSPYQAPFTGTAIYLDCEPGLWDAAWSLWAKIVPTVDGCAGVAGGYVRELVKGKGRAYVVYVGWDSIEQHDHLHHTEFFFDRRIILGTGNDGWSEYGHVQFIEDMVPNISTKL